MRAPLPYCPAMSPRLRIAALLAVGAFGVHQLRYLVAHGDGAGTALANEGHAYLGALAPAIAVLLGAAALEFLLALVARSGTAERRYRWIAVSASLLAVYIGQESLEGLLAGGHPAGFAAVVGGGGWGAVPLAGVIGLGITLLLRGADSVLAGAAQRRAAPFIPILSSRTTSAVDAPSLDPLAWHLAGRGPPTLLLN